MRNVAVIFGGPSLEHEVSVVSGRQVLEALDQERFRAVPVLIERDGAWVVAGERRGGPLEGLLALRDGGCEVVFPALHGPFGEDGTLQGFLETAGMPFVGSGMAGSALAGDKTRAKRLLQSFGVYGAADVTVPPATVEDVRRTLGFPVVVKNPYEGSTLGLRLATDTASFEAAVAELAPTCDELLVERRELGRELTAPVIEDPAGEPECLPLVEIRARNGFFDYHEKYSDDGADKIVPAQVGEDLTKTIQSCALKIHRALGLRGLSRSDFILRPDQSLVFLETNTIPGLTPSSLLPYSARSVGISFTDLLTRLIENALRDAPVPAGH